MSFGAGYGDQPFQPGGLLASEADREATQAVLKQAFEDQRLTQEEFEARVGSALSARTQGELAALTRDLPQTPAAAATRRPRRTGLLAAGIAGASLLAAAVVLVLVFSGGPAAPVKSAAPARGTGNNGPAPSGPGGCPVGTSSTARTIADALASDPVYVGPGSSILTAAQVQRLRAEIGRADPGRIRMAAVTPATVRRGGGERALANAVASCQADAAGVTLVTTSKATYLVTSYPDDKAASQAVGAALNTHASLAAGLTDATRRLAAIDPNHG